MHEFGGQTAIVTGGTRGIGRAVSEAFLRAGARVIATYASDDRAAAEFKDRAVADGANVEIVRFDVADYAAVESFFEMYPERFGALEILVNNSGIRRDAVVGMMKHEDWRRVLDVNLGGVYNMCKFAVRLMSGKRYGRIVNIGSPSGRLGFEGQANYAASKAGMIGFTKSLAREVARRKITVNCVSPGFIETDFIKDLPADMIDVYKKMVPLGRFGKPSEVAEVVLFVAGAAASYVTGATIEVAGGI